MSLIFSRDKNPDVKENILKMAKKKKLAKNFQYELIRAKWSRGACRRERDLKVMGFD